MEQSQREEYGAAALRSCLDDIVRLTRFDAGSVQGAPERVELLRVLVEQSIEIGSEVALSTRAGHASGDGPRASSASEFERLIAAEADAARTGSAIASTVAQHARGTPFGGLQPKWKLGLHPRSVFHEEGCHPCSGRGRTRCNSCSGQGMVTCSRCGGTRSYRCEPCSGSGGTVTTTTREDGSWHRQEDRCIWCQGSGQRNCDSCQSGQVTCITCHGRGDIECHTCAGHGTVTQVATISLSAEAAMRLGDIAPDMPRAALAIDRRIGVGKLASVAANHVTEWAASGGRVSGETRFQLPIAELALRSEDHLFRPLALGDDATIWDYDGAIEHLLASDLGDLERGIADFRAFDRAGDDSTWAAVRLFCESEANQGLLTAAMTKRSVAEIVEAIKGTVSSDYVERTIAGLNAFVSRLTRRELSIAMAVGSGAALVGGGAGGLLWWFQAPEQFTRDWLYLLLLAPLAWLLATGVGWLRTAWRLKHLGGKPLRNFARRRGLGLFARLRVK